jgi:inosine/xanthosine triphosphatase
MKKVIVASTNPVKIQAAADGFAKGMPGHPYHVEGIQFPSPVSAQPFGDEETLQGARQRALTARDLAPDADFWVGVEGGADRSLEAMYAYAWVVILSNNQCGQARSAAFLLPRKISELVMNGVELGHADDIVFGRSNSKQQNGAVGILTADAVDRRLLYEQPVMLALIPFLHPELYPPA